VPRPNSPTLRPAILVRHGRRWRLPRAVASGIRPRHTAWAAQIGLRSARSQPPRRIEVWVGRLTMMLAWLRRLRRASPASRLSQTLAAQSSHAASPEPRITPLRDRPIVPFANPSPVPLRLRVALAPVVVQRWARPDPAKSVPTRRATRRPETALILGYSQLRSVFREVRTIDRASPAKSDSVRAVSGGHDMRRRHSEHESESARYGGSRPTRSNDMRKATTPLSTNPEQIDIEVIADRVLQRIQRRAIAWRERLGGV
jgi:hypothetical protein